MNSIKKKPLKELGYGFIDPAYIPPGKDEYYIRNEQAEKREYRALAADEIKMLVKNGNTASDWNDILVTGKFNPELVKHCRFYGLVRIGDLEDYYLEFHDLGLPVGLYHSTVISSDIGSNAALHNVRHLSHYLIGEETALLNIDEMVTTGYAKFGSGMVKDGEEEAVRIRLEICNENGGRSILPFEDILPGDAYLWSKYRGDAELIDRFERMCTEEFDTRRGFYGSTGSRCVIKDCRILKDVKIGSDCYIKGANKLKNLSIRSSAQMPSQIGEGCELVNGIIGYGCRVFYGVKAVRFVLRDASSLKYGARLINSILGDNSTISCCEVLNSLIFPGHEQHHNNSFLCASTVMGQSNIAAGATIGSNHNSRGNDGELVAGRGFWPGLCVSLKHNSRFASYCLLAKGSYPAELDIPLPFSLISNDEQHGSLTVMPGYWFLYNMYAVARNAWKYSDRDKRHIKEQDLEFGFLAPDTAEELFAAMEKIEALYAHRLGDDERKDGAEGRPGKNAGREPSGTGPDDGSAGGTDPDGGSATGLSGGGTAATAGPATAEGRPESTGPRSADPAAGGLQSGTEALARARRALAGAPKQADRHHLQAVGFEASKRPVRIVKAGSGYASYRRMLRFYCIRTLAEYMASGGPEGGAPLSLSLLREHFSAAERTPWINAGGQLVPEPRLTALFTEIKQGRVSRWEEVHRRYRKWAELYPEDRAAHAAALLRALLSRETAAAAKPLSVGPDRETSPVDASAAVPGAAAEEQAAAGRGEEDDGPFAPAVWTRLLDEAVETYRLIAERTASSREKDYRNPFRKMTYRDEAEMEAVVGTLAQNSFITHVAEEAAAFEKTAAALKTAVKAETEQAG